MHYTCKAFLFLRRGSNWNWRDERRASAVGQVRAEKHVHGREREPTGDVSVALRDVLHGEHHWQKLFNNGLPTIKENFIRILIHF